MTTKEKEKATIVGPADGSSGAKVNKPIVGAVDGSSGAKVTSPASSDNGIVYPNGNPAANAAPGTPLPKSWGGTGIPGSGGGTGSGGGSSTAPSSGKAASAVSGMSSLAAQQNKIAQQQAKKQVDHAVQQGVNELTRAEADAQEQFQTQQNQVDIDEAKALDNQALYAEARGDRGGIGQAQYGQIQATALNNRRAINTARTKLATDTQRQIADLRAQGEFQKADAILQLTQTYLGQLMDLQKWGAEFSMQEAQFNAQLDQWAEELALKQAELTGEYGGQKTWEVQRVELEGLAEVGIAEAQSGRTPTAEMLAAMKKLYGIDQAWVDAQISAYRDAQTNEALAEELKMAEAALGIPNVSLTPKQREVLLRAGWTDAMIASKQKETNQKHRKDTYIAPVKNDDTPVSTKSVFEELYDNNCTTQEKAVEYLMRVKKFKQVDAEAYWSQYSAWLNKESFNYKYGSSYKGASQYVFGLLSKNKSNPQAAANAAAQYVDNLASGALTEYGFEQLCAYIEKQTGVSRNQWEF